MADVLVKPAYIPTQPDTGDATKFGPNAWIAPRLFSAGNEGEVIVRRAASATGAAWEVPASVAAAAGTLTGPTLASNVLASSLTSLGTLSALNFTGQAKGADGTALLPAYSFTAEPTTGFWRSGAGAVTLQGALTVSAGIFAGQSAGVSFQANAAGYITWAGRGGFSSSADGKYNLTVNNNNAGVGLDVATDAVLKIRTRAQTGDASLQCLGLAASASITASGGVQAGASQAIRWAGLSQLFSTTDGTMIAVTTAGNVGAALDFSTDATLKVRTRAFADTAILDVSRHSAGGTLGVVSFGPAAVTSITVKGGIITAIS